jgi:hypothetical protein
MNKLKKWWLDLTKEEYHVTIWYDTDPKAKTVYKLKSVGKLNNRRLEGVTIEGSKITLSVEVPFNYEVRKIH